MEKHMECLTGATTSATVTNDESMATKKKKKRQMTKEDDFLFTQEALTFFNLTFLCFHLGQTGTCKHHWCLMLKEKRS